jgi:hypothetical protein
VRLRGAPTLYPALSLPPCMHGRAARCAAAAADQDSGLRCVLPHDVGLAARTRVRCGALSQSSLRVPQQAAS